MTIAVHRHHWVNTVLGFLDATWHLTDAESVQVSRIISNLLDVLNIPERGAPAKLPMPLLMEAAGGFYSAQVNSVAAASSQKPVREIEEGDVTFEPDIWRAAIAELFTTAYPDLDPYERLFVDRTIGDLLDALGVDTRAAQFISSDVARAAQQRS